MCRYSEICDFFIGSTPFDLIMAYYLEQVFQRIRRVSL